MIYAKWINEDKKTPLEDVIQLATDLIMNGLKSRI